MMLGDDAFTRHKDRVKTVRTCFEILVVLFCLYLLWSLFFHVKTYKPFAAGQVSSTTDTGFVALSYFGVDRIGDTSTLIGERQLREQLTALKEQGYVTITQNDIEKYYKEGKPLPRRALYLMFEDGRRDTAIFADSIIEDLNFKGTMMTYPEKFDHEDPKFLRPTELKDMEKSTFWEMGTNGYRLEYINVYDRYHNFIGEIDPLTYAMMRPYLSRDYNHYLMDFIRDKDRKPVETMDHMKRRIGYDYERLRDLYVDKLGYVPQTYVLMHANTGAFGNAPSVSKENEKWIRKLFAMNFNREGYCFNKRDSSIYDLTRMQPQPYWPVNHLLMRIKYDTGEDLTFKTGDARMNDWQLLRGAAEYKQERILLTSLPESYGMVRLKNSGGYADGHLHVKLMGNSFGDQDVLIRGNKDMSSYLSIGIENGRLVVAEVHGGRHVLFDEKLSVLDGNAPISVDEDKKNVEMGVLEALTRYADTTDKAKVYAARLEKVRDETPKTVAEGAKPYDPPESFHARMNRTLDVDYKGNSIIVFLDGKQAARVETSLTEGTEVGLLAGWTDNAWSQRNLADDVYDGVYDEFTITTPRNGENLTLYTTQLTGKEKVKYEIHEKWEMVLGWFLKHF